MLLYVFWHWPRAEVDLDAYERDEAAFQRALSTARPEGLVHSAVFRCAGAGWVNAGQAGYEDAYLLETSAGLDVLNDSAVQGECKEPHDRLAATMQAGAGGLYSLRLGDPPTVPAGDALWLSKPQGTRYDELYARLRPLTDRAGVTLWRRQMVLGPAPELFLVGAPTAPERAVPAGLDFVTVTRDQIWPGAGGRRG